MKKGSALLVVLGMMSFIMVSAIAFSAYMRYARLPSSYLRRTASARQLVKAGLARAIEEIDRAVGNNPHPGIGLNSSRPAVGGQNRIYNTWRHRVFLGTSDGSELQPDETVSPLCLEALAYIPPPLVNEARYYSRRTTTAKWQGLDFDVGRYNYCALDVSDYFDINRLLADSPRSSSPQRRISMAYLFESTKHTDAGSGADKWDAFMNEFRGVDPDTLELDFSGKYPLVSLADFNLVLGQNGRIGQFSSPFYDYLTGGASGGFYGTESEADEERFRRMTFMTDSWFPMGSGTEVDAEGKAVAATELKDLNDESHQPFKMQTLNENKILSRVVLDSPSADSKLWKEYLSGLGYAALSDYLDPDHLPLSLAIPTVERVPMICGLQTVFPGSKVSVLSTTEPLDPAQPEVVKMDGNRRTVRVKVSYELDTHAFLTGCGGHVKVLTAYPFLHGEKNESFSVDGRLSFFFTGDEMPLRTGETKDCLHLDTPVIGNSGYLNGLINVKLQARPLSVGQSVTSPEDAVRAPLQLSLGDGMKMGPQLSSSGATKLLTVTYEWEQTKKDEGGVATLAVWSPSFDEVKKDAAKIKEAHCGIAALAKNGQVDKESFSDEKLLAAVQGGGGPRMILNAAIWLRVIDQASAKIVDFVPACWLDDLNQNRVNDPAFMAGAGGNYAKKFSGSQYPVLRFDTGVDFKLSVEELEKLSKDPMDIKFEPEAAIVADPRYNFAPEHWYRLNGELTPQAWLEQNHCTDGDGDIFMSTSDAGYLQSPFELAFLPRLTEFTGKASDSTTLMKGNLDDLSSIGQTKIASDFSQTRNQRFMWRTYDPFDQDADAFDELPWTSEGTGYKINPYSDSTNIVMAAFANTPLDWTHASTNVVNGEDYASMSTAEFNKKYAFNEFGGDTQIAWQDLEGIAGAFMNRVQTLDNGRDWRDAWFDMDWHYDPNQPELFCGRRLENSDDLWSVDRKYLYGFWHDCFASKQQLFLVFVRAEPMMMGSGVAGQMPPQLGARAVALVWRDPKASGDITRPHRMRVLFYRQFD